VRAGLPGDDHPGLLVYHGAPESERGQSASERPPHEVRIAKPFAVSKHELTFADWDACAAYGDCDASIIDSKFGRGRQPVINVSWADAHRYAGC
jgi:formylglycine-generating enzyme required for sulfatase activity